VGERTNTTEIGSNNVKRMTEVPERKKNDRKRSWKRRNIVVVERGKKNHPGDLSSAHVCEKFTWDRRQTGTIEIEKACYGHVPIRKTSCRPMRVIRK